MTKIFKKMTVNFKKIARDLDPIRYRVRDSHVSKCFFFFLIIIYHLQLQLYNSNINFCLTYTTRT
jgi:hypothetical protein